MIGSTCGQSYAFAIKEFTVKPTHLTRSSSFSDACHKFQEFASNFRIEGDTHPGLDPGDESSDKWIPQSPSIESERLEQSGTWRSLWWVFLTKFLSHEIVQSEKNQRNDLSGKTFCCTWRGLRVHLTLCGHVLAVACTRFQVLGADFQPEPTKPDIPPGWMREGQSADIFMGRKVII